MHEISKLIFLEKYENIFQMLSAEILKCLLDMQSVKENIQESDKIVVKLKIFFPFHLFFSKVFYSERA